MKLLHRFGYYLGGFAIGLIILAFFLQGKKTSCDYGPNARTTKNIANKTKFYASEVEALMKEFQLDTTDISNLIRYGNVDFSRSDTKAEGCKTYLIENSFKEKELELTVKNCDSTATIESLVFK